MSNGARSIPVGSESKAYAENLRRATLASSVGSALEYYDFALYGLASALIFGKLFFPGLGANAGLIAGDIAPLVGAWLLSISNNSWLPIAIYVFTLALIAFTTSFFVPETVHRDLNKHEDAYVGENNTMQDDDLPTVDDDLPTVKVSV